MITTALSTNLERQQQQEGLDTVEASVHKVTHEQIVGLGALAADVEQLLQVIELAVDVTANLPTTSAAIRSRQTPRRLHFLISFPSYRHGRIDTLYVALVHEDLARLLAKRLDLGLLEVFAALELLDLAVEVALTGGHDCCLLRLSDRERNPHGRSSLRCARFGEWGEVGTAGSSTDRSARPPPPLLQVKSIETTRNK